jgi:LuxR family maltose regulon positive regulatory protein
MKFEPAPMPSNTLERPRLVEALAAADAPLTLVVAGPGYGKTVAVGQWLGVEESVVAWVSLDRSDDSSRQFWSSVATSLQRATGDVGGEPLLMLDGEQDTGRVVAALLAELPRTGAPLIIVLDDVHILTSAPLLAELSLFIERLPPPVRAVATSRVDPQLPLGRWRASGRLVELRQADLRFTKEEVEALFAGSGMAGVHPEDVALLAERTEGWAAGLQLALLSLRGRDDVHDYIRSSLTSDRGIVDYLLGEVLASLSDGDRRLVLDLSILPHFDADLAVVVTGRRDAAQRVRSLEARNLLLLPADNRGERFRFHQLVRELLVAELGWASPGRDLALHAAAAAHLESIGALQEAAAHYVAAGDFDRAFRLIVEPAWELLDCGQVVAARQRLDLLPEGAIGTDPNAILAYLVLLTAAGRVDEADRWTARLEADGMLDAFEWLHLIQFFGLRSMLEYIRGDLEQSQLSMLHCLELLGDIELRGPVLDRLGAILLRQALDDRNMDAAIWWHAAMEDHQNASLVVRDLLPAALGARLAMELGNLDEAERRARHVVETADAQQLGSIAPAGEARTVLADVLLERGRLGEAEEHAALAAEASAERRLTVGEARARLVAIEVSSARFGPASGRRLLETTRQAFEHRYLGTDIRWWLDAAECRLCLLDGDRARGRRLLERLPSSNARCLLLARSELLAGDRVAARSALDGMANLSTREQVEALLLEAQASARPDSLAAVRSAAELAVRNGLSHTFLREGPEVLRLARRANLEAPTPQLGALLEQMAPAPGPAATITFTEPLTDRELELLRLLPTHLTYGEIADQLCVSINTVKTYQKALFRKLRAAKRSEAVAAARQAGLIDTPA